MKDYLLLPTFALFAMVVCAPTDVFALFINEIRVDQPGSDVNEYFELAGTPGESLNGLSYLALGDRRADEGSGVVEAVIDLDGLLMPASGYLLVAESTFSLATADHTMVLSFENLDNVTHLLVAGFSGSLHADLDANDDGLLDTLPWTTLIDSVALVDELGGGEQVYSDNRVGPVTGGAPFHIYRSPDGVGAFIAGNSVPGLSNETPGAANSGQTVPEPTALLLTALGLLFMRFWRTSRTLSAFAFLLNLSLWNMPLRWSKAVCCAAINAFSLMWSWRMAVS